jgi:DNA-binding NarL/FixJ family response regulator
MQPIRVTIFEDNKHLRESLYYLVNGTEGFECADAYPDCSDLLFRIKKSRPDVVLMDIEMPGINGIEGVKLIKANFPSIQILMQTVFEDNDNIFNSICAGASGYLLKTTSPAEYIEAVKDVYHGGSPMTGSVARKVLQLFRHNILPVSKQDYMLTTKETEVLQYLVKGFSFKMIAAAIGISYETVRTHMKNIYAKLHVNSNTEAVSKAIHERIV